MADFENVANIVASLIYENPGSEADMRELAEELSRGFRDHLGQPNLPLAGETVAVAMNCRKTAALFYDRVWATPSYADRGPASIWVHGGTDTELWLDVIVATHTITPPLWPRLIKELADTPLVRDSAQHLDSFGARLLSETLSGEWQRPVTPIYVSPDSRKREFDKGENDAIVAAIHDIAVPDEDALTWDQIIHFREDTEARLNYRRLVHWVDAQLVGKPRSYITDAIEVRLDNYESALKKHGIATTIGAIESLLDPSFIAAAGGITGWLALSGHLSAAAITGTLLATGKVSCSIARGLLDIQNAPRGEHGEVAYVYQIREAVKKAG
ncbi:MAG TPA: hypothetical protein VGJ81_03170 [Thermoanaerobaculia bacterium]|jgi:hypothetical protein